MNVQLYSQFEQGRKWIGTTMLQITLRLRAVIIVAGARSSGNCFSRPSKTLFPWAKTNVSFAETQR
jgi:hypothetical protein